MAENIDLADTFSQIGDTSLPSDGHSLADLLEGETPADWRNAVLIEHHGPAISLNDPDKQSAAEGNPTTYEAMRTKQFLYVAYADGEHEFYALQNDPYELHNIYNELSYSQQELLRVELGKLANCHGGQECWADGHVDTAPLGVADRARKRAHRGP